MRRRRDYVAKQRTGQTKLSARHALHANVNLKTDGSVASRASALEDFISLLSEVVHGFQFISL